MVGHLYVKMKSVGGTLMTTRPLATCTKGEGVGEGYALFRLKHEAKVPSEQIMFSWIIKIADLITSH